MLQNRAHALASLDSLGEHEDRAEWGFQVMRIVKFAETSCEQTRHLQDNVLLIVGLMRSIDHGQIGMAQRSTLAFFPAK